MENQLDKLYQEMVDQSETIETTRGSYAVVRLQALRQYIHKLKEVTSRN